MKIIFVHENIQASACYVDRPNVTEAISSEVLYTSAKLNTTHTREFQYTHTRVTLNDRAIGHYTYADEFERIAVGVCVDFVPVIQESDENRVSAVCISIYNTVYSGRLCVWNYCEPKQQRTN